MMTAIIEQIYSRNAHTVYKVCYMLVKNTHDAQDLTQSTFVKLMKLDKTFDSHEHEKAWLIRTATNECKDFLKSVWANSRRVEIPEDLQYNDNSDTGEVLERVVSLHEKYKLPIYLFYYEGYSTAEIAKMLGKHESTIRGRLHRGRKILKIQLEEMEGKFHENVTNTIKSSL
jgi:RNA polymerase sigma-70 factor (ECF subfamily)